MQVVAVTVQGEPEGIAAPVVSALGPRALKISWVAPAKPNGIIREYRINQSGVGVIHTETEGEMAYNVTGITYALPFVLGSVRFFIFSDRPIIGFTNI